MGKIPSKILGSEFFNRKTLRVAQELLGSMLVRKIDGKISRYKINEVEAYIGPHDLACHSSRGRTRRTEIMFGDPGTIYMYFIYGMYWMLNIVTEKKDYPAAILIRGVEGISGPGRLTKELQLNGKLNGKIANPENGLWFEKSSEALHSKFIKRTPRIGVAYSGKWAEKKYRFILLKSNKKSPNT